MTRTTSGGGTRRISFLAFRFVPRDQVAARREALAGLAAAVTQLAAERSLPCVNARAAIPHGEATHHLWDDAVHLSPTGSRLLARLVFQALRKHRL